MAWSAPVQRFTGDIITAAQWNAENYHNLRYLKGLVGAVVTEDDLTADNLITAGLVDGRDVSVDGTTLDSHSVANHTDITRTLYVPFQYGTNGPDTVGKFGCFKLDLATDIAAATFQIPNDYSSLGTVLIGIIPFLTGDFDWTVDTEELDSGEDVGDDTDSATANAQAATNIQLLELDITTALDGLTLAKGDWVGVMFTLDALNVTTDLFLIGISFGYTAEQ